MIVATGTRVVYVEKQGRHDGRLKRGQEAEENRKFDTRGKQGVMMSYGKFASLQLVDYAHLEGTGEIRLVTTRNFTVFHGKYPLKERAEMRKIMANARLVLDRLFDTDGVRTVSDVLCGDQGLCVICDKPAGWNLITCPGCRGRHRSHRWNKSCRKARCEGHTYGGLLRPHRGQRTPRRAGDAREHRPPGRERGVSADGPTRRCGSSTVGPTRRWGPAARRPCAPG